jgi:hypothetical protein
MAVNRRRLVHQLQAEDALDHIAMAVVKNGSWRFSILALAGL